jgi:hypothetical protein
MRVAAEMTCVLPEARHDASGYQIPPKPIQEVQKRRRRKKVLRADPRLSMKHRICSLQATEPLRICICRRQRYSTPAHRSSSLLECFGGFGQNRSDVSPMSDNDRKPDMGTHLCVANRKLGIPATTTRLSFVRVCIWIGHLFR